MKHIVIDGRTRSSGVGAGRYIDRLLDHLQTLDKKNQYTVLVDPEDIWKPASPNFTAKICPFKRFSFNFLDQLTFAWFLYQLKPDLVHFAMTPQEPMFYFGKRVTTAHDLTMLSYTRKGRLPAWLHALRMAGYRMLFSWSLKRAKKIIVPSKFVADDLGKHYPFAASKTEVTYEATEPEFGGKASKPPEVDRPFIMHVGSPFPHKNIDRLVDSFSLLKKDHPDLMLVLCGNKEQYFGKLQDYISQNSKYKDDIIITGFVSDQVLKWLYQNAECYVWPSLSEGFGLPALEAMVHGCPVASSDASCMPEVYEGAAIYFDPFDTRDMADKISELLKNKKLRKQLIQNGYIQIKKYSWKKMAEQTLEIYNEVLDSKNG